MRGFGSELSRRRPVLTLTPSTENSLSSSKSRSTWMVVVDSVSHISFDASMSVADIMHQMKEVGVLGAGRMGRATDIVTRMLGDPDCFTYLSMSGPMVPGGLRLVISHLVREGWIDAIVTSGANIVHDLIEAYGGAHYRVPSGKSDQELRIGGMGRIADIFVKDEDFEKFESEIHSFLETLPRAKRTLLAPSEFISELGATLTDSSSIVRQAYLNEVPIFSPGLMDSMLGFHMFTFSTTTEFSLDFVKDLRILGSIVTETKKTGAIMLGGGLTKHFTMGSTILKGGLDMAVQITLDRPEGGSLGGAPLVEGVSWKKIQQAALFETVIGDATILFPLLVLGAINRQ
ncbi:deoxyhypusine synthase [Candidatus Thorarchaeota archaeon]|nr:MAG: deoxyhypusine synthase [Candidatus Thorarchaeota archaeon]